MNRKPLIILVTITSLLIAAYLFTLYNPFKRKLKSETEFGIADTASITKLFLADKNGNQLVLEKQENGTWLINNTYKADPQKIQLLKSTLHDMKVRNPLAESEYNSTIANLATRGIKVEVYADDDMIKTIYVGPPTPDNTGTFMMLEGAKNPYVIHIPGFVGYLTPRFNVYAQRWRTKEICAMHPEDISSIVLEYPALQSSSFRIEQKDTMLEVFELQTKRRIQADLSFTRYYVHHFSALYAENILDEMPKNETDSIKNLTPLCILTVQSANNETIELRIFSKKVDKRTKQQFDEQTGIPLDIDPDKYYAYRTGDEHLLLIQQYAFGKVLRTIQDFEAANLP